MSRETAPMDTAVISITRMAAGEGAYNVIPEHASFGGSMRSLSHEHLMLLKRRLNEARAGHLSPRTLPVSSWIFNGEVNDGCVAQPEAAILTFCLIQCPVLHSKPKFLVA